MFVCSPKLFVAAALALSTAGATASKAAQPAAELAPLDQSSLAILQPAAVVAPIDVPRSPGFATIIPVSKRTKAAVVLEEARGDLGGRYAVMREKRDTGCMITLDDTSRVRGGSRAQLAPGCRDQGIVIFDPSSWQVIKGQIVLTARAGHKAHLQKIGEGNWQKDPKDGGKPLGLKKL